VRARHPRGRHPRTETGQPRALRARQVPRPAPRTRRVRHRGLHGHARAGARRGRGTEEPVRIRPAPAAHRRRGGPEADRRKGRAMSHEYYLILAAALFSIGAVGVLVRRNAIVVFMCVELMLNAGNLTLVTFARTTGTIDGQV